MNKELIIENIEPVFIVGYPRSGTTLLQLLISSHSNLYTGPETHLFQYILDPPVTNWKCSKLTVCDLDIIYDRLAGKPSILLSNAFKETIRNIAETGGISTAMFLHKMMEYFKKSYSVCDADRWVEKTPKHVLHAQEILMMFPKAKIINIIRDPRSVISSTFNPSKNIKLRTDLILRRSKGWNRIVSLGKLLESKYAGSVKSVYYENLIKNTPAVLENVMNFIGEKFEAKVIETFSKNFEKAVQKNEEKHKYLCKKDVIVDRSKIWKMRMKKSEIILVEIICEKSMEEHGYEIKFAKDLSSLEKKIRLVFNKMEAAARIVYRKFVSIYKIAFILKDKLYGQKNLY